MRFFGPPCISLIYITDIFVQTLIGPIFIVASVVFRWFFQIRAYTFHVVSLRTVYEQIKILVGELNWNNYYFCKKIQ